MNKNIPNNLKNTLRNDGEIDLKILFNTILRNKILIFIFSISFFFTACFYALTKKRIWAGDFQIVLNKASNVGSSGPSNLSQLSNLVGFSLTNKSSSIFTEIGILESPSVLMPVFEFVKKEQDKLNVKSKYGKFVSWKGTNLDIDLKKGTTILNITYRDQNKDLILPVLNKIANVYQDYSGKNTKRKIELTKSYIQNQIEQYRTKSFNSIKKAQEYGVEQDLKILDLSSNSNEGSNPFSIESNVLDLNSGFKSNKYIQFGENIGIEVVRINAANDIKRINLQIEEIKQLENTNENLEFISFIVPGIDNEGLPKELQELELEILDNSSKYTENSNFLKILKSRRKLLADLLKKKAIGFLEAERLQAESRMEAAKRPKGVLLKYKSLIRDANRDEATLIKLEDSLRAIELEESKKEDPWELITKPTVKNSPVAPNVNKFGLIGILLGVLCGISYSIIKEKRSDLIFDDSELVLLLGTQIFEKISWNDPNLLDVVKDKFIENILLMSEDKSINFFTSNDLEKFKLDEIKKRLTIKNNISFTNNLRDLKDKENIFLLTSIPFIKYYEIHSIKKWLEITNNSISGIVLI